MGRSKDSSDIVIDADEVSFQHCHLEYAPSTKILFLRNTSSNGTYFQDFRHGDDVPTWQKYERRPLLACEEIKLLVAGIKIGPAQFLLRKGVPAGTSAHPELLRRLDEYAKTRFKDLSLTELKVEAGGYQPTRMATPGGEILVAPTGSEFKRIAPIGSGAFGTVYKVIDMCTGKYYAQKALRYQKDDLWYEMVRREIICMSKVSHEHIVEFAGYQDRKEDLEACYVMALYSSNLESILPRPLIGPVLCLQLLQAVAFLHEKSIIHRDIKPANILLECENPLHIRLADFGLSKIIEDTTRTYAGSPCYMAPEIMHHSAYNNKVDIYAIGMTLYVVLGGLMPSSSNHQSTKTVILSFQRGLSKRLQQDFCQTDTFDILSKMLHSDHNQRPTALECLREPYVTTSPSKATTISSPKMTAVARFRAVLDMKTSDKNGVMAALDRRKKVNLPVERRTPTRRAKTKGIREITPVREGRVMKKERLPRPQKPAVRG